MSRPLTFAQAEQLEVLLDDYKIALRGVPLHSTGAVLGCCALGMMLSQTLTDIHPMLPLVFLAGMVVSIFYLVKREKIKRVQSGRRTPWDLKREMKTRFNLTPNQARAALARVNGPTVLDTLAASNAKASSESMNRMNVLKRFRSTDPPIEYGPNSKP